MLSKQISSDSVFSRKVTSHSISLCAILTHHFPGFEKQLVYRDKSGILSWASDYRLLWLLCIFIVLLSHDRAGDFGGVCSVECIIISHCIHCATFALNDHTN